jgi:hypothetical protein
MDSQEKQFLNADEVEANPEILRHADARQQASRKSTYPAHSTGSWSRCKRAPPTGC